MVKKSYKKAFTLIELIFAIVIMSIAVMSLPMMARITSETIENNILQEAIFAGSTELMGASAGYWDTNSMSDNNMSHLSRVVDIGSSCENNTSSSRNRLRPGHIAQTLHRRCVDDTSGNVDDSANATFISLNNAHHSTNDELFTDNITNATGYKETYRSTLLVTRAGDIKTLTSLVTDNDGNLITRLRMQSANIGEIDYYKRRF
ncbi:type II secretion system GspH family protein [Sulfurimonas sp.]|nr:type II secretion system GspH family protein [Sulfurimonas sp.]